MKKRIGVPCIERHEKFLKSSHPAEIELRHRQTLRHEKHIEKREFLLDQIPVRESARNHEDISLPQRSPTGFREVHSLPVIDADQFHTFVRVKFCRGLLFLNRNPQRKISGILKKICRALDVHKGNNINTVFLFAISRKKSFWNFYAVF